MEYDGLVVSMEYDDSEKILVSWDDDIPNIWKNIKCSKPPTRYNTEYDVWYLKIFKKTYLFWWLYNMEYDDYIIWNMMFGI